jgi:hypothetical protein
MRKYALAAIVATAAAVAGSIGAAAPASARIRPVCIYGDYPLVSEVISIVVHIAPATGPVIGSLCG